MEPSPNPQSPSSFQIPTPLPPPPPPPLPLEDSTSLPPAKRARRHSKIRYHPLYMDESEREDVQKYVPGGFHPVDIGDKIAQYTVLHKLGSGGFATVWLVQSSEDNQYYALKILCAAGTSDSKHNEQEVLEHLGQHDHPSVTKLLHSFEVTGPNGVHTCLVLPVCGPSLYNWSILRIFTHSARYQIAQQVASGVAFLHERGVTHIDLTPSNIVFSLPEIQSMPPDAVCQLLGPIIKEKVKLHDGSYSLHSPRRIIKNPDFSGFNIGMTSAAVMIIDFGEAFLSEKPRHTGLGVPITSFPPEVLFRHPPSASSDVWELACLFCEIFYHRPLFPLYFPIFEMLIGQIVHFVGLLPRSWRGHFNAEKYGYMDGGEVYATPEGAHFWFQADPQDQRGSLREELREAASRSELTTEQQDFIVPLLQEMLVREPEGRLPARDALRRLEFAAPLFGGEVAEHLEQIPEGPDDAPPPPPPPPPESDDSDSLQAKD